MEVSEVVYTTSQRCCRNCFVLFASLVLLSNNIGEHSKAAEERNKTQQREKNSRNSSFSSRYFARLGKNGMGRTVSYAYTVYPFFLAFALLCFACLLILFICDATEHEVCIRPQESLYNLVVPLFFSFYLIFFPPVSLPVQPGEPFLTQIQ